MKKKLPTNLPKNVEPYLKWVISLLQVRKGIEMLILLDLSNIKNRTFKKKYLFVIITKNSKGEHLLRGEVQQLAYHHISQRMPFQISVETIGAFNNGLSKGNVFFSCLKKQGIFLFNSGHVLLVKKDKKIVTKDESIRFYQFHQDKAKLFMFTYQQLKKIDINMSSFQLHQCIEHYLHAAIYAFLNNHVKTHDLIKLSEALQYYVPLPQDLVSIFREDSRKYFQRLNQAYNTARYDTDFFLTEDELEKIVCMANEMIALIEQYCSAHLKEL